MRYYTIQDEKILIAENKEALTKFYNNVLILPDDWEEGKYIVINGQITQNPNFTAEKEIQKKIFQIEEIKSELDMLDKKRIRAVCENDIKDSSTGESWLDFYNKKIKELRKKLADINI